MYGAMEQTDCPRQLYPFDCWAGLENVADKEDDSCKENPFFIKGSRLKLLCLLAGVLAGAIDYYILDKYQRLANTKPYDEVQQGHRNYRSPFLVANILLKLSVISCSLDQAV